jgi:hypothetical protein
MGGVMTYDDLVKTYGNGSKAASALGLARQTVHQWKVKGIPFEAQYRIQIKTRAKLKAELPK